MRYSLATSKVVARGKQSLFLVLQLQPHIKPAFIKLQTNPALRERQLLVVPEKVWIEDNPPLAANKT